MIDWEKSAELNNCTVDDLKVRFERFPKSNKRIIAICEGCGKAREIYFESYCDFCHKCSVNTPEYCKVRSDNTIAQFTDIKARETIATNSIEYWSDQNNRDKQSKKRKEYFRNNPKAIKEMIRKLTEYWSEQSNRNKMSDIITNSKAHKIASEKKRGGNDTVNHHYIYDHSDLSKYTTKMTRSKHTYIHNLMRKAGIKVPHINIEGTENE